MSTRSTGGEWRPVEVRFLEGGRAQKTPASIFVQGIWQDVHLLEEALAQSAGTAGSYERRFTVKTLDGQLYLLRGGQEGPWRVKDCGHILKPGAGL